MIYNFLKQPRTPTTELTTRPFFLGFLKAFPIRRTLLAANKHCRYDTVCNTNHSVARHYLKRTQSAKSMRKTKPKKAVGKSFDDLPRRCTKMQSWRNVFVASGRSLQVVILFCRESCVYFL